jgi:lambda repressor-like predicted transcriptional regulator
MLTTHVQEPLASSAVSQTDGPALVPIPASSSIPAFKSTSTLTPVVCDERAIGRLLETILHRSGLSIEEVSRRMGVTSNTIRQYLAGRRSRPSLLWFVKVAGLCGATVTVQFPDRR